MWVSLALGGFHNLANQCIQRLFFASLEFGDIARIGGNHFIYERLDGARVSNLLQALSFNDVVGALAQPLPQCIEHFLADCIRNGLVGNAGDQTPELFG